MCPMARARNGQRWVNEVRFPVRRTSGRRFIARFRNISPSSDRPLSSVTDHCRPTQMLQRSLGYSFFKVVQALGWFKDFELNFGYVPVD